MRRLLALSAVAVAVALGTPAHAATCEGGSYLGACVDYGCTGDPCHVDPSTLTVYTYCQHPLPQTVCVVAGVRVGPLGPR
jgi:hypothetical protein